jgi:hypothetical protein
MRRETPAVRILPMSDREPGFVGKGIEWVQRQVFLRDLPASGGRFRYRSSGLSARAGTIVLFQYRARVVAMAEFVRDEKYDRPRRGHGGAMHFDVTSIRTFEPVDVAGMRKAWPGFARFGHVKQVLNASCYAAFRRSLRRLASPAATERTARKTVADNGSE